MPKSSQALMPLAILAGPVSRLGEVTSGIAKSRVPPPWTIGQCGLEGDEQADPRHHGGPEKALHHYAFDHYRFWRDLIGSRDILARPGAFGENIATLGWTEAHICIGDIFRFGSAVLQVSQARQPCFKLNIRLGDARVARTMQVKGVTGWYYRVLEAGEANSGDRLEMRERPQPDWSLARILDIFYRRTLDRAALEHLANLPELTESWRKLATSRLQTGAIEDWKRRLGENK